MSELEQIMSVMTDAFDPDWNEAWSRRQITDALVLPYTHAILLDGFARPLDGDGQAAAFAMSRSVLDEEELLLIGVRPEQRRNGLGRRLLDALVHQARLRKVDRLFLEVRENNSARAFYAKFGFEQIGRRKDYYRSVSGETMDAITMGYQLPTSICSGAC